MDWDEILSDSKTYADDVKVAINGTELTLGQLRNKAVTKSDFTKRTQELSSESKKYQDALTQHQQALAAREQLLQNTQRQLAQLMQKEGVDPRHAQDDDLALFRSDPSFSPFIKIIDTMKEQNEKQEKLITGLSTRIQQDEHAVNAWRYQMYMDKLKEKDPELDTQALAKFATEFYGRGVDVDATYKLMNFDKIIAKHEAEAEQRGYQKAKSEPAAPPMPGGGRSRSMPTGAPSLPKSLDERMVLAEQDPAVMEGLEIGLQELQIGS